MVSAGDWDRSMGRFDFGVPAGEMISSLLAFLFEAGIDVEGRRVGSMEPFGHCLSGLGL